MNEENILAGLTQKQRQVLDLLIQHKTSKEIARRLDISPHTVDQRIKFAKEKLGAHTRSEVAVAYRRMLEIYGKMTYDDSGIAADLPEGDAATGTRGPQATPMPPMRTQSRSTETGEVDYPVGGDLLEGQNGTLIRLGAIVAIAVLVLLLVLGALATFSQLSELMEN